MTVKNEITLAYID